MVRGLIIRQTFLLIDLVLFGSILLTAGLVVAQLFATPSVATNAPPGITPATDGESLIMALRDRKDYDTITASGLFGDAGRFSVASEPPPPPPPPEPADEVVETELNLKLWGTTSLSPTSIYASASIEDVSQRTGGKLYFVGDDVVNDVTLEEVHPRWVILRNNRESPPQLERLKMDDEDGTIAGNLARGNTRPARPAPQVATRVDLNKEAFIQELYVNYAELVTKVRPELYRDASGRVAGITAADISDVPLAKQLGLENGDVLQTVNNERIDSEQKILEMVQKYQNVDSFRIGILRNGTVQNITYNLR